MDKTRTVSQKLLFNELDLSFYAIKPSLMRMYKNEINFLLQKTTLGQTNYSKGRIVQTIKINEIMF